MVAFGDAVRIEVENLAALILRPRLTCRTGVAGKLTFWINNQRGPAGCVEEIFSQSPTRFPRTVRAKGQDMPIVGVIYRMLPAMRG